MQGIGKRWRGLVRLSLRTRLVAAFAVLLAALACMTLLAVAALTRGHLDTARRMDQATYQLQLLADLRAQLLYQDALITRHVSATSDAKMAGISAQIGPSQAEAERLLALLAETATGPSADMAQRLAVLFQQEWVLSGQVLALSRQNSNVRAAILSTNEMPAVRARVLTALDALSAQDRRPAVQLAASQIAVETNGIAAAEKNALLSPEDGYIARQLDAVTEGRDAITVQLDKLHQLLHGAVGLPRLDEAMQGFAALDDRIGGLLRDNTNTRATDLLRGGYGDGRDQMLDVLAGLSDLARTRVAFVAQQASSDFSSARLMLVLLADGAIAVGLLLAALMCASLGSGLDRVTLLAERLAAGEGCDMETGLALVRGGQAGRLGAALSRLAAVHHDVIDLAGGIAAGDLSPRPLRRCEDDPLGGALEAMVLALAEAEAERRRASTTAQDQALRLGQAVAAAKADAALLVEGLEPVVRVLDTLAAAGDAGPVLPDKVHGQLDPFAAALHTVLSDLRGASLPARQLRDFAGAVDALSASAAVEASRAADQGAGMAEIAADLRKLAERNLMAAQEAALRSAGLTDRVQGALTGFDTLSLAVDGVGQDLATARAALQVRKAQAAALAEDLRRQSLIGLRCLTSIAMAGDTAGRLPGGMAPLSWGGSDLTAEPSVWAEPAVVGPAFASRRPYIAVGG